MSSENNRIIGIENENLNESVAPAKKPWLRYFTIFLLLAIIGAAISSGVYYLMWKKDQAGQRSRLDSLHPEEKVDSKIMLPGVVINDPDLKKGIDLYKKDYIKSAKFTLNEILEKNKPDNVRSMALIYLGIIADEEGKFNLARDFFQRAVKLEPDNFYAHYNLAISLRHSGNYLEAIKELKIAKRINPSLVHPDLLKGEIEYETENYASAEETFRGAAERGNDPLAYYNLGLTYKKEGKIAEAKTAFLEALNKSGAGQVAALSASQLGILYATSGDYRNAEEYFNRCVHLMPAEPKYYYNLARVQYAMKKYEDALRNMSMAEKYGEKNPKIYVYLSRLYAAMNEKDRSFLVLKKAMNQAPRSSMILHAYSDAAVEAKKWNEAIIALRRVLEISTGSKERSAALFNLGKIYLELSDLENAESYLQRAADLDPVNEEIIVYLARAYMRSGKKDKSVEAFNKAIKINPDNAKLRLSAAKLFYEIGLIGEAENHFKRTLEQPGISKEIRIEAMYFTAKIAQKREEYDRAVEIFKKLPDLNPNKETLEKVYLAIGDSILKSGKPSALAIRYIEKALAINPASGKARILLADALLQKGDLESMERAEENLTALIHSVTDPSLLSSGYTFRGILYYKNGMYMKSLEDFNKALEMEPSNQTAFHNRKAVLARIENR